MKQQCSTLRKHQEVAQKEAWNWRMSTLPASACNTSYIVVKLHTAPEDW